MAYCPESMVEWSTRWEEVKKTMVRGLDFTEDIMHRTVYKGLYLTTHAVERSVHAVEYVWPD